MNVTGHAVVVALWGLSLAPGVAHAQDMVSAASPESIADVIRELGFQARMDKDGTGDPLIRSSANGVQFQIEFYGCTDNAQCESLRFYAGYDLREGTTLDVVNEWNKDKRFLSAYLDEEDDPYLQMDINTEGGISRVAFASSFEMWQSLKSEFEGRINFKR